MELGEWEMSVRFIIYMEQWYRAIDNYVTSLGSDQRVHHTDSTMINKTCLGHLAWEAEDTIESVGIIDVSSGY